MKCLLPAKGEAVLLNLTPLPLGVAKDILRTYTIFTPASIRRPEFFFCSNGHLFLRLGTPICIRVTLGDWKEPKLTPKCMGESKSKQRCIKEKQRES